jgi:ArsR family transcriptional regulator
MSLQKEFSVSEFDSILTMIENPVRRAIIKRLSQEPSYALQLAKELGLGQQLVTKHLDALEDANLVSSFVESSPSGPNRKEYVLAKSVSLTVDFAPNLYSTKLISLDPATIGDGLQKIPKSAASMLGRIEKIVNWGGEDRFRSIGKVIAELDAKIQSLEEERSALLYIRNLAMSEVVRLAKEYGKNINARRVLYHILDSHEKNVSEISESVNLREETVRDILRDLERSLKV